MNGTPLVDLAQCSGVDTVLKCTNYGYLRVRFVNVRGAKLQRRVVASDPELDEISASDTREGLTTVVLSRAFDPFFTTKGVGKGTGLMLSQVYGMARQAGGAVRIESRVSSGTVRLLLRASS